MENNNGNGHRSIDLEHLDEQGFKELFPGAASAPLLSGSLGESNPGVRLLSNDETITEMLKGLNFNDEIQAARCAASLGENEIFLFNKDGKINAEVERIRNRIKYRATSQCSVKGLMIDQYKQAAIGVATSTSTRDGWRPLTMPSFPKRDEGNNGQNNKSTSNRKP